MARRTRAKSVLWCQRSDDRRTGSRAAKFRAVVHWRSRRHYRRLKVLLESDQYSVGGHPGRTQLWYDHRTAQCWYSELLERETPSDRLQEFRRNKREWRRREKSGTGVRFP